VYRKPGLQNGTIGRLRTFTRQDLVVGLQVIGDGPKGTAVSLSYMRGFVLLPAVIFCVTIDLKVIWTESSKIESKQIFSLCKLRP
jgi:hypothetical protein